MIYNDILATIGRTPLVDLQRIAAEEGLKARLLAKVERTNPGGSVKDRVALAMVEAAEKAGTLRPGGTIVEPTSGNTGVGLALVAAVKGYRAVFTMPETMSVERRQLLAAYGAELVLTPGAEGMKGAIAKATEIVANTPGAVMPLQFENAANPAMHEATTAEEIWADTEGAVDAFVAGVGTGGTVTGTARGLKRHKASVLAVAVEPKGSPVLSGGAPGKHGLQGIGAGFVPKNYDAMVVDRVVQITEDEAYAASRRAAEKEGLLVGITSGAALHAAIQLAKEPAMEGKTIVVLLPDTGERYLSTPLFAK